MTKEHIRAELETAIALGAEVQVWTSGTLIFGHPLSLRGSTVDLVARGSSRPTAFALSSIGRVRRLAVTS